MAVTSNLRDRGPRTHQAWAERFAITSRGFLGRLPPELALDLIHSGPLVRYPAASLSPQSREGGWAAVVVSGVFRQYLPVADGRQLTIRYATAGYLVGSLNLGGAWPVTEFEAIETSDLLHLDVRRLERTARWEPELSVAIAMELADLVRDAYVTLANVAYATVRARIARDLLARSGLGDVPRHGTQVRVTQQALAAATGSVREVVSRALRELRLQGIVKTSPSGVTILEVDALIAEASRTVGADGGSPRRARKAV